jgi:hypothetical protein
MEEKPAIDRQNEQATSLWPPTIQARQPEFDAQQGYGFVSTTM